MTDALIARGEHVVVLDDFSTGRPENLEHLSGHAVGGARPRQRRSTPSSSTAWSRRADACLHLASAVGVQLIVSSPLSSLLGNVRGTDNVFAACVRHGKRLLFTSTSEVYGKNCAEPLGEDADRILGSAYKSRWAYAMAKGFGRGARARLLPGLRGGGDRGAALQHGRYRGRRAAYGMVLPRFVRQALNGEDLTVYGNGTQTRCFTHVADTVEALAAPARQRRRRSVSCTTSAPRSRPRSSSSRGGSSNGLDPTRRCSSCPTNALTARGSRSLGRRKPETRAIRELTGWEPTRTIDDAINDVVLHEQSRRAMQEGSSVAH